MVGSDEVRKESAKTRPDLRSHFCLPYHVTRDWEEKNGQGHPQPYGSQVNSGYQTGITEGRQLSFETLAGAGKMAQRFEYTLLPKDLDLVLSTCMSL